MNYITRTLGILGILCLFQLNSFALSLSFNPSSVGCGTTTVSGTFDNCNFNGNILVFVNGGVELDPSVHPTDIVAVSGGVASFTLIVDGNDNLTFTLSGSVLSSNNSGCAPFGEDFSGNMTHTCILPVNDECVNAKNLPVGFMTCSFVSM